MTLADWRQEGVKVAWSKNREWKEEKIWISLKMAFRFLVETVGRIVIFIGLFIYAFIFCNEKEKILTNR